MLLEQTLNVIIGEELAKIVTFLPPDQIVQLIPDFDLNHDILLTAPLHYHPATFPSMDPPTADSIVGGKRDTVEVLLNSGKQEIVQQNVNEGAEPGSQGEEKEKF